MTIDKQNTLARLSLQGHLVTTCEFKNVTFRVYRVYNEGGATTFEVKYVGDQVVDVVKRNMHRLDDRVSMLAKKYHSQHLN